MVAECLLYLQASLSLLTGLILRSLKERILTASENDRLAFTERETTCSQYLSPVERVSQSKLVLDLALSFKSYDINFEKPVVTNDYAVTIRVRVYKVPSKLLIRDEGPILKLEPHRSVSTLCVYTEYLHILLLIPYICKVTIESKQDHLRASHVDVVNQIEIFLFN